MTFTHSLKTALCLTLLAGSAAALAGADRNAAGAVSDLMRQHPGARVYRDGERVRILYGAPMTTGATAREAAERFLAQHGDAFGVGALDLHEWWSGDVRYGKFWAFSYSQRAGGLPVELSPGRVLVRDNLDGTWSVVYAAGLFAAVPSGGFPAMTQTAQDALDFVQGSEFGRLPKWSQPELAAYPLESEGRVEAVRAWKFVGENPDLVLRQKYTFFVDAATGALLEARNEVLNTDVFGFVKGYGSPGNLPDEPGNEPALLAINDIQVRVSGGSNDYSDQDGFFNITHGGSSDVTILANFDTGMWCNVNDQSGTPVQSVSGTATPGDESYLEFNTGPSQYKTAQVNAFIHTGKSHNLLRDRTSWTGMDFACAANVNIAADCNAYFDGGSINFYRAGSCKNSAYTTVVAHEYGHYVVQNQGLGQGSFGEGYGDSLAEMTYDTGIIAEHFYSNGQPIRDNDNTIITYPCNGPIHTCGQVLGGTWWHMRENFGETYGSEPGFEEVRQLFADWTLITTGGSGNNSAHPGTAIEVLTLDDNDGDLSNGSPNYYDIEDAFELHGIDVPDVIPLNFAYPNGLPDQVLPTGGTTLEVIVTGANGFDAEPGTGVLHVDGGSGFVEYPMTELTDNHYVAEFPGFDCGTELLYYVSAEATDGTEGRDPQDAPDTGYSAMAAIDFTQIALDNFETSAGWTVQNENLSQGAWERGRPAVMGGNAPQTDYDGSGQCYLTGNYLSNSDVDGGPTRLRSKNYDIAGLTNPIVSFAYWFFNNPQDEDRMVVEVSGDDGATWVVVTELAHGGRQWLTSEFAVRDSLPDADTVRVRFSVMDRPNDSETEAGIDAFAMADLVCGESCVADFNGDGTVNTQDVLAFLNAWSAGDDSADINGDGTINTQDVLAFLNLWSAGC